MNIQKVGTAIKVLRRGAGYTQHQLAELMGVTDQAVSKWERGLSAPDVSIITKLSIFLNVDVDNLLEGNVTFIEKEWQGLLVIKNYQGFFSGTTVYDQPLVYVFLSYFILAGIKDIYIMCPESDAIWITNAMGDIELAGIKVHIIKDINMICPGNTMVVYNNPFVYGPNLTKYFQRAMSRSNGITILSVQKALGDSEISVISDNYRKVIDFDRQKMYQYCVPILFFPKYYHGQLLHVDNIKMITPLYVEPMGNGMIEYLVSSNESLWETAGFFRYIKKQMGNSIYDLMEISKKRSRNEKIDK